jgi:hypothetical protein
MLTVAVMLVLADLATTLLGIRIAGADGEDNPLWRGIIRRHGLAAYVAAYAAVMTAILFAASLAGDAALAALAAVFALVVLNNLLALWRLTAPQTAAGAKAAAETEIRHLGARWVEAFRTGDVEAFAATYTDDAFLALAGQPALRGKAQVVEFFAPRVRRSAPTRARSSSTGGCRAWAGGWRPTSSSARPTPISPTCRRAHCSARRAAARPPGRPRTLHIL